MIEEVVEATKQLHHDEEVVSTASSQVTLVNAGKCEQGKLNEATAATEEATMCVDRPGEYTEAATNETVYYNEVQYFPLS